MRERRQCRAKAWDLLWDSLDGVDKAEFFAQLTWRAYLRPRRERRQQHVLVIGGRRWRWTTWRAAFIRPLVLEAMVLCGGLLFWLWFYQGGGYLHLMRNSLNWPWPVTLGAWGLLAFHGFVTPLVLARGLLRRFDKIGGLMAV